MTFAVRELLLVAIHGEGNRATVIKAGEEERALKIRGIAQTPSREIPPEFLLKADPPPDVMLVCRDPSSPDEPCAQFVLRTWEEVDAFKAAYGGQFWDEEKKQFVFSRIDPAQGRHMPFGTVKVTFE